MKDRQTIFVLIREGPSGEGLIPHLRELIVRAGAAEVLGSSRDYPGTVRERLAKVASEGAVVDLVFVHRDSDAPEAGHRRAEIAGAAAAVQIQASRVVPVVPIQEIEAWLLLDEVQIREVVGKPSGRTALHLPGPAAVESLTRPKETLAAALLLASQTTGRRREMEKKKFGVRRRVLLERLDIDGPVRKLTAWRTLENDIVEAVKTLSR